jgi:signal transduction histidine kinase
VVLEQLTRSIDADTVAIFLVDADLRVTEARTHGYTLSMPEQLREHRRPPLHHLRVLQTGTSILVKDAAERNSDAILVRNGVQSGSAEPVESCASWIGVPLNTQGKTIGLIALSHRKRRQLRRDDALLALAFANQVAAAVDSVRSKEQAVRAAAMTERARLARELHDSVSQALFGVSLGVRTGLELLPPGAESARPISYALELAEAALLEMRALIFEMRPESLREEGLVNALKRQAGAVIARYKAEHGSQLNLNLCDREPDVPLETKEALYRISLEALTNAAKHAKATAITLDMSCDDDRVHLVITDNGRGFDPNALYPGHLGLTTMRERAELFGGNIDFDSAVGHGTRITVTVPHGDRVVTR